MPNSLRQLATVDAVVLGVAVWLLVAALPFFFMPSYFPRLAALVAVLPIGVLLIADGVSRRDRITVALAAFTAWALLCSITSDHPMIALLGAAGRESSWLIYVGAACLFALGRRVGPLGRSHLGVWVVGALVLNALLAVVQIAVDADRGMFSLYLGRAHGLLSAHVYLGAVMAGGCGLVVATWKRWTPAGSTVLLVLFGATIGLSGARSSLVAAVAGVAIVGLVLHTWRVAAWGTISVAAGIGAGWIYQSALSDSARNAVARAGSAGFAGRTDAWGYGVAAALDRPVLGWGPSQFRAAVQGRFTESFTERHAANAGGGIWFDSHNVAVSVLVAFGLVGFVLACWFGVEVVMAARGEWLAFGLIASVSFLVQPLALASFPIVMLALGLAIPPVSAADRVAIGDRTDEPEPAPSRTAAFARPLALSGLVLGLLVVAVDLHLDLAADTRSSTRVERTATWLWWDPVLAGAASSAHEVYDDDLAESLDWARRAVERETSNVAARNDLAETHLLLGDVPSAVAELDRVRALQPYNTRADALRTIAVGMNENGHDDDN